MLLKQFSSNAEYFNENLQQTPDYPFDDIIIRNRRGRMMASWYGAKS
jgi:hypothetical protein